MYTKGDEPIFMTLEQMPTPGYTARELERLLNLPDKKIYRLVKAGQLEAYRDVTGQLRVHQSEIYRYMREQENK